MPRSKPLAAPLALGAALLAAGCDTTPQTAMDAVPDGASLETQQYAAVKTNLDLLNQPQKVKIEVEMIAPAIQGLGYSQVSTQPGKTTNERRLMAIRAARMEAMRDLTEQVHGLRLNSETTVRDMALRSDVINGVVSGEIRGAKTKRITPKDNDTFEVVLELDVTTVAYILKAAKGRI